MTPTGSALTNAAAPILTRVVWRSLCVWVLQLTNKNGYFFYWNNHLPMLLESKTKTIAMCSVPLLDTAACSRRTNSFTSFDTGMIYALTLFTYVLFADQGFISIRKFLSLPISEWSWDRFHVVSDAPSAVYTSNTRYHSGTRYILYQVYRIYDKALVGTTGATRTPACWMLICVVVCSSFICYDFFYRSVDIQHTKPLSYLV